MQSYKRIFLWVAFCVFLLLQAGSLQAAEGLIEEVSFQKEDGGHESVVFQLNGQYLPYAFSLNGEKPRLVFDFPATRLARTVPQIIPVQGSLVQKVRLARYSEKIRAVIDLFPGGPSEYEQSFDEEQNTLTIRLFSADLPEKEIGKDETIVAAEEQPTQAAPVEEEEVSKVGLAEAQPELLEVKQAEDVEDTGASDPETADREVEVAAVESAEETSLSEKGEAPGPVPVETQAAPMESSAEEGDSASVPLLSSIRFEDTDNKGEMVLFQLNGFYPPTVSGKEEGTPQVICDFSGAKLGEGVDKDQASNGKYIQRARVQQLHEEGLIRVSLELVPNKYYDLQQVFFKEDSLFVIIVNSYDDLVD